MKSFSKCNPGGKQTASRNTLKGFTAQHKYVHVQVCSRRLFHHHLCLRGAGCGTTRLVAPCTPRRIPSASLPPPAAGAPVVARSRRANRAAAPLTRCILTVTLPAQMTPRAHRCVMGLSHEAPKGFVESQSQAPQHRWPVDLNWLIYWILELPV